MKQANATKTYSVSVSSRFNEDFAGGEEGKGIGDVDGDGDDRGIDAFAFNSRLRMETNESFSDSEN